MKQTATFLVIAAANMVAAITASAQADGPAEVPPASFQGDEYVDSTGCVFSRVGIGAEVVWVPRVGSEREPLCGRTPTMTADATPDAAEQDADSSTMDMAAAEAPMVRPVPQPQPMRTTMRRQMQATSPSGLAVVRHAPQNPMEGLVPVRAVTTEEAAALGAPGVLLPPNLPVADVYLRNTCPGGPAYAGVTGTDDHCRVAPMHRSDIVHGTQAPTPAPSHSPVARLLVDRPTAPAGYSVAWDDGRLNPYRGIRTEAGEAQTRMVWTDTVPRRLVPAE